MASRGKHSAPSGTRKAHLRPSPSRGAHSAGAHSAGAHSAGAHSAGSHSAGSHSVRGGHSTGGAHSAGAHYRRAAHARRRARRRKRVVGAVSLVAVVVLVAGIAFATNAPTGQLNEVAGPQRESAANQEQVDPLEEYANVVTLVNQADRTVVPLSKVISKSLDAKVARRIDKILDGQKSATALLDEANARLQKISPQLAGTAREESAPVLSDLIAARKEMLVYGCRVLRASSGAYRASDKVVAIWRNYLEGQASFQKASDAVSSGTTGAVNRALKHDKRALGHFERAAGLLDEVQQIAPNVDLSVERSYAETQKKAAQAAIESDRALLEEDAKAAKKHNAEYGEQAVAAAKIAKTLPATTDELVETIYYSFGTDDVSVQKAQNSYEKAAKRAAKDDKRLAGSSGSDDGADTSKEN